MLVTFSPIFVADTKIIFGYNFVAPLIKRMFKYTLGNLCSLINICVVGTSNELIIKGS